MGRSRAPDSSEDSIFFGWLLGRLAGFSDHVSNFLQAICQISELIAAAFGGEYQLSQPVDLIFILQETKAKPEFYRVKVEKRLRHKKKKGRGWGYHDGHLLAHRLCDPVGGCQMEPDFSLGIHWKERDREHRSLRLQGGSAPG